MKKTLSFALVVVMLLCVGLTACGDSSSESDWVGDYKMTDEWGDEWTLSIVMSDYQEDSPGELQIRIGDMFSDLATPDENDCFTCVMLDCDDTATFQRMSDGSIVVTCDSTSMYAPPAGTYTK